MAFPEIVDHEAWAAARADHLAKEKALTRELDALAAERRRLPVEPVGEYVFGSPDGDKTLLDLFGGKRQLLVYHFMGSSPDASPCPGCSSMTDNVPHLDHMEQRDARYVVTSRHDVAEQQALRERFGWAVPFFSCAGTGFHADMGVGGGFGLSVFIHDDAGAVYRSYFTNGRGVDRLRMDRNLLDLVPFGRQEAWEDSPEGWPQYPTYSRGGLRDEY